MEEKRQLEAHLRALEGCKLAETLLQKFKPLNSSLASTVATMAGEQVGSI